jgi:predicted nucleic-acid-binding Zn-ribbon protein
VFAALGLNVYGMKNARKCPKCGSTDIIADARVIDRGDYNVPGNLSIEVRDAHMGRRAVPVSAYYCELCGYIEFYAAAGKVKG